MRQLRLLALSLAASTAIAWAQTSCPATPSAPATPAAAAFAEGRTTDAETAYTQELAAHPDDPVLAAGLLRTLLRLGKISEAATAADQAHAAESHSAPLLTALAELQLRQGQPWQARKTLTAAIEADPCFGRSHLILSRLDRLDSMYASERSEIGKAHELDPNDPDIQHLWKTIVGPANDSVGVLQYIASTPKMDAAQRKASEDYVASMRPLLLETTQNCRGLPDVQTASIPLQPMMRDGRHIDGYRLPVTIGTIETRLIVDTAASGLFISRALATAGGLTLGEGDPSGTVRAPSVRVGPLEFHDCLVGVSDTPFPDKEEGFVGTDLFSASLITLDQPQSKLELQPLPPESGLLPGDRTTLLASAPQLSGWQPVYHKSQYLLVPVTLDGRERSLFVLDTGIRYSTMRPQVAALATASVKSATSPQPTVGGATIQVYRSAFELQFGDLVLRHQDHVIDLDNSAIEQRLGMEIGGLLGFDALHAMTIHLDYRDGLAKFESSSAETVTTPTQELATSSAAPFGAAAQEQTCSSFGTASVSTASTIEARTTGLWESNHFKPGQKVNLAIAVPWNSATCSLPVGANLYGHVTTESKTGQAELGLEFDHGECLGKGSQPLNLKIVSVAAPPNQAPQLHSALPSAIGGGTTRQIGDAVSAVGGGSDIALSDTRSPHNLTIGSVVNLPDLALNVSGGPGCSALLTGKQKSFRLGTGTAFIMVIAGGDTP